MIYTAYSFLFDPEVVPIIFALEAMLALVGTMIATW